MTKAEIKELMSVCKDQKRLCRVFLRYDLHYRYYFPLLMSEKLFLGAEEDDFILNGYAVRRFKDVTKVQFKNDMCDEILKKEGIVDSLTTPDIDLTNWETVFTSLQKRNKNIIAIKESLVEDEAEFVIGRIEKVYKRFAYVRHFDADGNWQEEPYRIPYAELTTVIFASRYVDVFSKYLGDLPADFGK